jgi:hypothetical protein
VTSCGLVEIRRNVLPPSSRFKSEFICFLFEACFVCSLILKTEALRSSKRLPDFKAAIPVDSTLQIRFRDNLKSYTLDV